MIHRPGMYFVAVTLLIAGCDGFPFGSSDRWGCMAPASRGWTHLGLEDQGVVSVEETPWGLMAGTLDEGVMWCDPGTGTWVGLGLAEWVPWTMLWVPGPEPRFLVGLLPKPRQPPGSQRRPSAVFAMEELDGPWLPWDGGLAEENDNNVWPWSLAVDPGNPLRLFMGLSAAVYRSEDGGLSWEAVIGDVGLFAGGIRAIAVSPDRSGRVWAGGEGAFCGLLLFRSGDWGDTWDVLDPFGGCDGSAIHAFAIDVANPDRVWAGLPGGVIRSEDGGATWHPSLARGGGDIIYSLVDRDGSLFAVGSRLVFDPDLPDEVDVALVLFRTNDGGQTWTELDVPPGARMSFDAMLGSDGGILIATGNVGFPGGVWRYIP